MSVPPASDDTTSERPTPRPPRSRGVFVPWWAFAAAIVVMIGAAGIGIGIRSGGGSSSTPKVSTQPHGKSTITLTGALELDNGTSGFDDTNFTSTDGNCNGTGGYTDLAAGTSITVYDNTGAVISVGNLSAGSDTGDACIFAWSIPNVPKSNFYKVEISHRGQLTYSYAQATSGELDSSIGK